MTEMVELTPELVEKISALRGPMPERVTREGVALLLNISPAMVDYLTVIGVFTKHSDGKAEPTPKVIGTRDAMRLIGMTDKKTFYKRVRLGFYRSFGPNNFSPEMLVADHQAYLKTGLAEGDYRSHAKVQK
jgi:hypothetical protein